MFLLQDAPDLDALKVENPVSFSHIYSTLPSRLSSKLAENLSASLAVVALLHLANEKNLQIKGDDNFVDFIVSQA